MKIKFSKNDQEAKNKSNITIKQSTRRRNIVLVCKVMGIICISSTFGYISAMYTIKEIYNEDLKESKKPIFKIIDTGSEAISQRSISNISKTLVGISNTEDGFKDGESENTTGIIIKSNGYIITSYNAIVKYKKYFVKVPCLGVKNVFEAKLIGYDGITDIAVLKIEKNNLISADMSEYSFLREGDKVVAVGNAYGSDNIGFLSSGLINSLNKKIEIKGEKDSDKISYNVIETDTLVNNENTGGILMNKDGQVIGVVSKYISDTYSTKPLNYVILSNEIEAVADSIINYGRVKRTSLGFDGVDLIGNKDEATGVYVQNITPDATAAKAGIRPTDIIIEFDHKKVECLKDITDIMKNYKAGDEVSCVILRDGKKKEVKLIIEEAE